MPKRPYLAVDTVIIGKNQKIVLIKRKNKPFKGEFALPGGFLEYGETVKEACKREVKEETGLETSLIEMIGVFSDPNRDPRGHILCPDAPPARAAASVL